MKTPSLEFIQELYTQEEIDKFMKQFRDDGYVVLPDVLKVETVDPFVEELKELMFNPGNGWTLPDDSPHYVHCAKTPRGYQVLPDALSRSVAKPFPCLHTSIIVIQKGADDSYIPEWHKDREPEAMPEGEYHWPLDVFLGYYFEDMTIEHGPTVVLPGSHRDVNITPWNGKVEPVNIYCRKQDALLLDQRTWHRGTKRTAEGDRFLLVYGYYAMPHFYSNTFRMPRAQRKAWIASDKMRDRVFWGGPFAPPNEEDLQSSLEQVKKREEEGNPLINPRVAY